MIFSYVLFKNVLEVNPDLNLDCLIYSSVTKSENVEIIIRSGFYKNKKTIVNFQGCCKYNMYHFNKLQSRIKNINSVRLNVYFLIKEQRSNNVSSLRRRSIRLCSQHGTAIIAIANHHFVRRLFYNAYTHLC